MNKYTVAIYIYIYISETDLLLFLQHLIFLETNISRLPQLAALAQVRRLDQLTIHPEGNPVVSLALWRSFVIYRLHHFNLQRINGQEVRTSSVFNAVLLLYKGAIACGNNKVHS